MWVPLAVGSFIGFLGQAVSGTAGLAVGYGVLFLLLVGYGITQRGRASAPVHRRVDE
ncbi:MAG TPA: hypothetical protein VGD84_00580 [Pseudonocardiaceae bacterium]